MTPFFLVHGYEMRQPRNFLIDQSQTPRIPFTKEESSEFVESITGARNRAREAIQFAQETYRSAYNSTKALQEFEVGDKVLINPFSLKLSGEWKNHGHKLLPRFEGPFEITDKLSPSTYQIRLPPDYQIHPVLHISHLKRYHSSTEGLGLRPIKAVAKRQETRMEDWEVAEITEEAFDPPGTRPKKSRNAKRSRVRTLFYRAKWVDPSGQVTATDEWVNAKNFRNAPEVVRQWQAIKEADESKRAQ
jgi:ribosomal protein L21E